MHAQARSKPAKSPADLAAFLKVLADGGVSVQSASGSDIEQGGEFAFGLIHDGNGIAEYQAAKELLEDAGYTVRVVVDEPGSQLHTDRIPNEAGELLRVVMDAIAKNAGTGRVIKDIAVGAPHPDDPDHLIPVQIYSDDPLT